MSGSPDGPREPASNSSLYRRLQNHVRTFNKHVLNPVVLGFAGRPHVPYGVVRHVGRRSGRTYDTPVVVRTAGDRILIPLPYGADTDWCRNVLATGGCTVAWRDRADAAGSPRLVGLGAGRGVFPGWLRWLIRAGGAELYLALDRGREVPGAYRDVAAVHPVEPAAATVAVLVAAAAWLWRAARSRE